MGMKKLFSAIGIGILLSTVFGLISGVSRLSELSFYPYLLFLITYIPSGYFAAKWNSGAPYSAAYFTGVTIAVLNMLVAVVLMDFNVFIDADSTFNGLILGSAVCLLAAIISVKVIPSLQK
ncbi:hypothetical protein V7654_02630 [Bacillus sp. JJ1609]|uniref:hypothetical protein n=1 Tax=Bacillus sp. JJ1609 TaxID=3122977 RepID=UPI002FFDF5D6